jgi:hypothetical protein
VYSRPALYEKRFWIEPKKGYMLASYMAALRFYIEPKLVPYRTLLYGAQLFYMEPILVQ